MKGSCRKLGLAVVLIGAWLLGTMPSANANLVLTIDDLATGVVDIIIVDNADGAVGTATAKGFSNTADGDAVFGAVGFDGILGDFFINITTGISKPLIGSLEVASLNFTSLNISGGNGTLEIMLTDTDFNTPSGALILENALDGESVGGSTIFTQGFIDTANAEFGNSFSLPIQGPFGPGTFSNTVSGEAGFVVAPYSLTETATITHTTGFTTSTSFSKELTATPEPSTMLLLASGLAGLGFFRWRRKAA